MAAELTGPVVLVVDAVDEAGSMETRQPLLDAIAKEFPHLPNSVKIIITSRDEQDIRTSLEACSDEMCIEQTGNITEDIASYIRHRLAALRPRSHPGGWPHPKKLQALYFRAGNLFVWASAACNFIGSGRDHSRRLNQLLDMTSGQSGPTSSPLLQLTSLYDRILETAFPTEECCPADFHYVVGSIIVLETPLPWIELDSLLGLDNECDEHGLMLSDGEIIYLSSSAVIIDRLRSALREGSADREGKDGPIRLLHPSLYDFFTTHARGHFRIDITRQHQILAIRCLHVMNSELKFDICEIGDASLPNKEFSEACGYMSSGLRYAVISFVYHVSKVSRPNSTLINALEEFICEHILHWFETMSLLKAVTKAEECLQTLAEWIKVSFHCHRFGHIDRRPYQDQPAITRRMDEIVCDAIALLRNCGQAVRLSALHTYYSALPLTPKTRELFKCYSGKTFGVPDVICSHPLWESVSVRVLEGHTKEVNHVVCSPDGKKLASASRDHTLRLWDVENGQPIGDELEGHTSDVKHIVFSPDGKKLASASRDHTLRLWDVENGQPIGEALKGHTNWVNEVAFFTRWKEACIGIV